MMQGDPILGDTAHRHGIDPADTLHAYRNPIRYVVGTNDMTMAIDPATDGTLLEVGYRHGANNETVIVHSMPARKKFLPRK